MTNRLLFLLLFHGLAHAAGVPGQGTWETTLQPRDLDNDGAVDAWYDTALDVTWLADANLPQTTGYDADGRLDLTSEADAFLAMLNGFSYLGRSDWRLPVVPGSSACAPWSFSGGTNCGYNIDTASGELGYLYYVTLGNKAEYDTGGNPGQAGAGLTNTGPFANLQPARYWYGTAETSASDPNYERSFFFYFLDGKQYRQGDFQRFHLMILTDGDAGAAETEGLEPRDLNSDGTVDAYYDTVLDITWLADADYLTTINWTDLAGTQSPEFQYDFISFLRGTHHLGVSTWRLPNQANPNQGSASGELEHLYATTLQNVPVDQGGSLLNAGPFSNVAENCYLYEGPVEKIYDYSGNDFSTFSRYAFGNGECRLANYPWDGEAVPKVWPVADGDAALQVTPMATPPVFEREVIATYPNVRNINFVAGAYDLNNRGQFVGCISEGGYPKAFLYDNDSLEFLGTLRPDNSGYACASSINNAGEIVGYSQAASGLNGFFYRDGAMAALELPPGTPGREESHIRRAHHINDAGDITIEYSWWIDSDTDTYYAGGGGLLTGENTLETLDGGYDYSWTPTGLDENGNWLAYAWFGPGDVASGWATSAMVGGQPQPFTSGSWANADVYEPEHGYRWYGLNKTFGAYGNYYSLSQCSRRYPENGLICAPDERFAVTKTLDGAETVVDAADVITDLNDAGDMVGIYLRRPFYKPADGPTLFLDDLVDFSDFPAGIYFQPDLLINDRGDIVLRAYNNADNSYTIFLLTAVPAQTISIDIAPASAGNEVNLAAGGTLEVLVHGTSTGLGDETDFDVTQIDVTSLGFGPGHTPALAAPVYNDADGDSLLDALFGFDIASSGISCGDTSASLLGETSAGETFVGVDGLTTQQCDTSECHP